MALLLNKSFLAKNPFFQRRWCAHGKIDFTSHFFVGDTPPRGRRANGAGQFE